MKHSPACARIVLIFLCATLQPTHAGTLYRCVDKQAHTSYQSQPCPQSQRLDRIVDFTPEPVPPAPAPILTSQTRHIPRSANHMRKPRTRQPLTGDARCRLEKDKRETSLQRLGLSRTYDQLSRLDAQVRSVCGGY